MTAAYIKDPENKNKLIIDEDTVHIVQRIFDSFLNGESMCKIVRKLNEEKIPCPARYKLLNTTYKNAMAKRYLWTQETIKRILTNPTYMGDMTQRRQEKINYKIEKYRKIPKEDWIIVKETHEPIVSQEKFDLVQHLIEKKVINYEKKEKAFHLLKGLICCKSCGAKVTYRRRYGKMVIVCSTYIKHGKSVCHSREIKEETVERIVIEDLRKIANCILDDSFYEEFVGMQNEVSDDYNYLEISLAKLDKRLIEINEIIKSLYEDKVKDIISEDMFIRLSCDYTSEKDDIYKRRFELEKQKQNKDNNKHVNDCIKLLKQITHFEIPNKILLSYLIEKIEMGANKEIEIFYSFPNPY